jgi:hypothetical protein
METFMSKLIYLASPYSKYPQGKVAAFEAVCEKAAEMMLMGDLVFCPIAHSHPIEDIGMVDIQPGNFWLKQDFAVLERCDELAVYKMPSWEESYGVRKEIEFAQKNNIPVTYIEYD